MLPNCLASLKVRTERENEENKDDEENEDSQREGKDEDQGA
jgi:hypothetical protein